MMQLMGTAITIRNVPDDVRNELAARAARSGRSLQEYLLLELTQLTENPSMEDWVEQVRARKRAHPTTITRQEILADLDAIRGRDL